MFQIVNLPDTTCRLDIALNLIEKNIQYFISYNADMIPVSKIVSLNSTSDTLIAVLKRVINDRDIQYKVIGNQIVIYNPLEGNQPDLETGSKNYLPAMTTIYGKIKDASNRDLTQQFPTLVWIVKEGSDQ